MDKDKLGPIGTLLGTLSFMAFGVVGYINLKTPDNLIGILFGIVIGFLFGFVCKFLLSLILSLLNRDLKAQHGKGVVKKTVKRSTIFMFPFAVMAFLAAWFMNWTAAGVFFSAAVMNTGVMASVELSKLRGKAVIRNTIATSIIASLVSYLWLFSADYLKNGPMLLESAVSLVSSLTGVGK